jgi:hypothetical protein
LESAASHDNDTKLCFIVGRCRRAKAVVGPGNDAREQQSLPPQQKEELQPQRRVKTLLPKIRRTSALQSEDNSGEKHIVPLSPPPPYTTSVASVSANKSHLEVLEGEG